MIGGICIASLPKDYFKRFSPADLVTEVSRLTLAVISQMTVDDLIETGWYGNPTVDKLYSLTSAGVWISKVDTSGYVYVRDQEAVTVTNWHHRIAQAAVMPTFTSLATSTALGGAQKRYYVIPIVTSGAGAAADTIILPAVAGYKGCFQILGIISSITEAATTIDFEDEDDTDLEGNLSGGFPLAFTASTMNTQLSNAVFRALVSKGCECDVTGHAAGGTILLYVIGWYELV